MPNSDDTEKNAYRTQFIVAVIISTVVLGLCYFGSSASVINIWQLSGFTLEHNAEFPSVVILDELTHFFYARDMLGNLTSEPLTIVSNPNQFVQLALDEWGRPGNTITYAIASQGGMQFRRYLAVILLVLTSAKATMLAYGLVKDQFKSKTVKRYVRWSLSIAIPLALWLQPWFFYYGAQSLTQVPFMFFLTAAMALWIHGKYRWASFFIGLLPITRHESLPLILLWVLYLYRSRLYEFFSSLYIEIRSLNDTPTNEDKKNEDDPATTKTIPQGWNLLLTFTPYVLWNVFSLAFRNDAPFLTLFESNANQAYTPQELSWYFFFAQDWIGEIIFPLLLISTTIAGIVAWASYRHPKKEPSESDSNADTQQTDTNTQSASHTNQPSSNTRRNQSPQQEEHKPRPMQEIITEIFLDADQENKTNKTSRYTWWLFYVAFFFVHVVIITRPQNDFASGGYEFFILPIAPAVAIMTVMIVNWLYQMPKTASVLRIVYLVLVIAIGLFLQYPNTISNYQWSDFSTWLPDRPVELTTPETTAEHLKNAQTLASRIDNYLKPTLNTQRDNVPFIMTTNPVVRYALENGDNISGSHHSGVFEIVSSTDNTANVEFRLCPRRLWDIDPTVPFYPNLMPENTLLVLDGLPAGGLPSNYMVTDQYDNGYKVAVHHLFTTIEWYMSIADSWEFVNSIGEINPDLNPSNGDIDFAENNGFLVYQKQANPIPPKDASQFSRAYRQQQYAERYCGYTDIRDNRRVASVTVHHQAVYAEVANIFVDASQTVDNLPESDDELVQIIDCDEGNDAGEECDLGIEERAYVEVDDGVLVSLSLDNLPDDVLYVPPRSLLPVLECEPVSNRIDASWCLVVFGDTAFGIDGESQLSYTRHALNLWSSVSGTEGISEESTSSQDTADSRVTPPMCDFTRGQSDNMIGELELLPDLTNRVPILSVDVLNGQAELDEHGLMEDIDGYSRAQYTADALPRGDRAERDDRLQDTTIEEGILQEAVIITPGCFGWVMAGRRDGNTILFRENLANTLEQSNTDSPLFSDN